MRSDFGVWHQARLHIGGVSYLQGERKEYCTYKETGSDLPAAVHYYCQTFLVISDLQEDPSLLLIYLKASCGRQSLHYCETPSVSEFPLTNSILSGSTKCVSKMFIKGTFVGSCFLARGGANSHM